MFLCLSQKRKGDGESLRGGDEKNDTSQVRGKESDEKRRENVHFLILTVFQAQECMLTVSAFLLQLAELGNFSRDLMTHKACEIYHLAFYRKRLSNLI